MTTSQVEGLPMQGRNVTQLTTLMAGYTGTWNGLPTAAQGNNVDGVVSSTSRMKFGGNATPGRRRAPGEYSGDDGADRRDGYGPGLGNSAMQINMATRRGGNAFHGMLFEDHRNAALNANSWINNARGIRRPALILNDFGGNFGGRILRDKLFFFGSMAIQKLPSGVERQRERSGFFGAVGFVPLRGEPERSQRSQPCFGQWFPQHPNIYRLPAASAGSMLCSGEAYVTPTSDPNINNLGCIYSARDLLLSDRSALTGTPPRKFALNFFFNRGKVRAVERRRSQFPRPGICRTFTAANYLRTSYTLG